MKTTKLHVENVHVHIEKRKNDERVVQTHADLKKHKMGRFAITDRGIAVGLNLANVSNQAVGLQFSIFLANG